MKNLSKTLFSLRIYAKAKWVFFLLSSPLFAHSYEGASCHRHMDDLEGKYGIPTRLLSAIGLTESGHPHPETGESIAWPWAIHAEGKAYYPQTKSEAIGIVRSLQKKGITSIDVGCMQVNLHHHKKAFKSLDEAFDPYKNVTYAAEFLKRLNDENKSWQMAVAHYHSATPSYGVPYRMRVYKTWREEKRKSNLTTPPTHFAQNKAHRSRVSLDNSLKRRTNTELALNKTQSVRVGLPIERKIPKEALVAHNRRYATPGGKPLMVNQSFAGLMQKS